MTPPHGDTRGDLLWRISTLFVEFNSEFEFIIWLLNIIWLQKETISLIIFISTEKVIETPKVLYIVHLGEAEKDQNVKIF